MAKQIEGVYERILECAKKEFLEKGYTDASLRTIASEADTSTNSIYVRFKDKEGLFAALVDSAYAYMMGRYKQAHESFENLPMEKQPEQMGKMSSDCMNELLTYSFAHMDEVYLILKCSDGTKYACMVDDMVELEVEASHKYYKVLEQLGASVPRIDERLEHILATGMLNAFFEMVLHKMPFEDAKIFLRQLSDFYTAGWAKLMGQ